MSPQTDNRGRRAFVPLGTSVAPFGGRVGTSASLPVTWTPHAVPEPTLGSDELVTGVIDTGIVLNGSGKPHRFLEPHILTPYEEDLNAKRLPDEVDREFFGHGTFVAGIIAQQAPGARIRLIAALTDDPDDYKVAEAIDRLAAERIDLVNLSFGGHSWELGVPDKLLEALTRLTPDTVVVAAAGNSSVERKIYPAALEGIEAKVIAVGAADSAVPSPRVAEFSAHGSWVDVYASGVDVPSTYLADGWATWSGSSFAAAVVTGEIARVRELDPSLTTRAAAEQVLAGPQIMVWGVNGPQLRPYVGQRAPAEPRS